MTRPLAASLIAVAASAGWLVDCSVNGLGVDELVTGGMIVGLGVATAFVAFADHRLSTILRKHAAR
jgi:NO-binding membrane sensor protein with MHYT domain